MVSIYFFLMDSLSSLSLSVSPYNKKSRGLRVSLFYLWHIARSESIFIPTKNTVKTTSSDSELLILCKQGFILSLYLFRFRFRLEIIVTHSLMLLSFQLVSTFNLFCFRSSYGVSDICVLEDQKEHHPVVEIRIKECRGNNIVLRWCAKFIV